MHEYELTLRALLCPHCGGPIDVPIEGGLVKCSYCGAANEVVRRPLARDVGEVPPDEDEPRLPELVWPSDLGFQLKGRPADEKMRIVLAAWLRVYGSVAKGRDDPRLDERLYVLTMGLHSLALQLNDPRRVRAALESAMEATHIEPVRASMCAHLALNAAVAGDRVSAQGWLGQLESRFLDVFEIETVVRLARAKLALDAGEPEQALRFVGAVEGRVAMGPSVDLLARLLRLAAHERLGQHGPASHELDEALVTYGPKTVGRVRLAHGLGELTTRRGRRGAWGAILLLSLAAAVATSVLTWVDGDGTGTVVGSGVALGSLALLGFLARAHWLRDHAQYRTPMGYE